MGGGGYFRPDCRMMLGMLEVPGWAMAILATTCARSRREPYAGPGAGLHDTIKFAREQMGGTYSWDEVKPAATAGSGRWCSRACWSKDAEKAMALDDGIVVSNGGRQIEALPAPIDCVPAIVRR